MAGKLLVMITLLLVAFVELANCLNVDSISNDKSFGSAQDISKNSIHVGSNYKSIAFVSNSPKVKFLRSYIENLKGRSANITHLYDGISSYFNFNDLKIDDMSGYVYKLVHLVSDISKLTNFLSEVSLELDDSILEYLYDKMEPQFNSLLKTISKYKFLRNVIESEYDTGLQYLGKYLSSRVNKTISDIGYTISNLKSLGFVNEDLVAIFTLLKFPPKIINYYLKDGVRPLSIQDISKENEPQYSELDRPRRASRFYEDEDKFWKTSTNDDLYENHLRYESYEPDRRGRPSSSRRDDDLYRKDDYDRKESNYDEDDDQYYYGGEPMSRNKKYRESDLDRSSSQHSSGYGYMMQTYGKDPFKILAGLAFAAFIAPLVYNIVSSKKGKRSADEEFLSFDFVNPVTNQHIILPLLHEALEYTFSDDFSVRDGLVEPLNHLWGLMDRDQICSEMFMKNRIRNQKFDSLSKKNSFTQLLLSAVSALKGRSDLARANDRWIKNYLSSDAETEESDLQLKKCSSFD